jgi:hypothetical protein
MLRRAPNGLDADEAETTDKADCSDAGDRASLQGRFSSSSVLLFFLSTFSIPLISFSFRMSFSPS